MPPRAKTTPRKKPAQRRSRETVEAILEATARVLVRDGYDRASTNRVAAEAGVSVGSLYQYFPSKEALVAALLDGHLERMREVLRAHFERAASMPLREAVHEAVAAVLHAHAVNPTLHRVLSEQLPRVGRLQRIRELDRELEAMLLAVLTARGAELRVDDLPTAAFVLVRAVEALAHAAVHEAPERLADGSLLRETVTMLVRYLAPAHDLGARVERPAAAPTPPPASTAPRPRRASA